jgi:lysophospholipase L1-like esterase
VTYLRKIRANVTRSTIVNYSVVLISILLTLSLTELLSGYLYTHLPESNGKRIVDDATTSGGLPGKRRRGTIMSHPYLLYVNQPGFHDGEYQQINSLGYRNDEFDIDKPPNSIRVLALGGSTTNMWPFVKNPKKIWTSVLEDRLRSFYKRDIQVINAGLPYATSAELLAGYVFRHRYLKADLIIFHEGGNDVPPLMFADYNPEYSHFRSAGAKPYIGKIERMLLKSNFFKILYSKYWNPAPTVYVSQPQPFNELPKDVVMQRIRETKPTGFERNLDLLITIAKSDGANVLLFGFLQARESNLAKGRSVLRGLEHALVVGLEKNYEVMDALAKRHAIDFLKPNQDDFPDDWFQDNAHLNEAGEAKKAEIVFDEIVRANLLAKALRASDRK